MLEVLIGVLVTAFGLLGLAGLQATNIRNNHSAYLRNQATLYAYDIVDRMRANRVGLDAGNYNLGPAGNVAACHPSGVPSGCTSAEMAKYDLYSWNLMLNQLPGGKGVVCIDSAVGSGTPSLPNCNGAGIQYVVKIWWNENGSLPQVSVPFQP